MIGAGISPIFIRDISSWYLNSPIDGVNPTLWLKYSEDLYAVSNTSKTFNQAQDFSRLTTGTYLSGSMAITQAAIDEYRLDYQTGTRGLSIEPESEDLFLNSEVPVTQNITVAATEQTLSFYGTGSIVLSGTHSATLDGDGAYPTRTSLTFTPTAGTLTLTLSGDVQYPQFIGGSCPTSYIPTAGAPVTRAADINKIEDIDTTNWFSASEGWLYIEFEQPCDTGETDKIIGFGDGTTNNRLELFADNSGGDIVLLVSSGGASQVYKTFTYDAVGQSVRVAVSYKENEVKLFINGDLVHTDTSCLMPVDPNLFAIGKNTNSDTNFLGGVVHEIMAGKEALTDSQGVELTLDKDWALLVDEDGAALLDDVGDYLIKRTPASYILLDESGNPLEDELGEALEGI